MLIPHIKSKTPKNCEKNSCRVKDYTIEMWFSLRNNYVNGAILWLA